MGIEPTNHMISMRLNGFEDRGRHQPSKHFQLKYDRYLTKQINPTGPARYPYTLNFVSVKVSLKKQSTNRQTANQPSSNSDRKLDRASWQFLYSILKKQLSI